MLAAEPQLHDRPGGTWSDAQKAKPTPLTCSQPFFLWHRASLDGLRKIAPVPFANFRLCLDRRANIVLDSRRRKLRSPHPSALRLVGESFKHQNTEIIAISADELSVVAPHNYPQFGYFGQFCFPCRRQIKVVPLHRLTRLLALELYSASARTGERNPQRQRR
jgi:hypothetical protein